MKKMGISSVQPRGMERFGDGNVTDIKGNDQGVANDSGISTPVAFGLGNGKFLDADLDSKDNVPSQEADANVRTKTLPTKM